MENEPKKKQLKMDMTKEMRNIFNDQQQQENEKKNCFLGKYLIIIFSVAFQVRKGISEIKNLLRGVEDIKGKEEEEEKEEKYNENDIFSKFQLLILQ